MMRYFWLILLVLSFGSAFAQADDFVLAHYKYILNESDSVLKLFPYDCETKFSRAVALRHLGRYEEAIADITFVIEECKDTASPAFYARAKIYQKSGRYREAIGDYLQAIFSKDSMLNVWDECFQIGYCYAQQQKNAEAIDWYSKAIEKEPSEGITFYNRGLIYHDIKNKTLACADLNKALLLGIKEAKIVADDICK